MKAILMSLVLAATFVMSGCVVYDDGPSHGNHGKPPPPPPPQGMHGKDHSRAPQQPPPPPPQPQGAVRRR